MAAEEAEVSGLPMGILGIPSEILSQGKALANSKNAGFRSGVFGTTGHITAGKHVLRASLTLQSVADGQKPFVICTLHNLSVTSRITLSLLIILHYLDRH